MKHIKSAVIAFIIFSLLFCGCGGTKSEYNDIPLLQLPEQVGIEGKEYEEGPLIGSPMQVELIGNNLLLFQQDKDCIVQKISANSGKELGCMGQIGQGPEEYISPYFAGVDTLSRSMYIWDVTLSRLREYRYYMKDDTINFELSGDYLKAGESEYASFVMKYIRENLFVSLIASINSESEQMFALTDKEHNVLTEFGEIPLRDVGKTLNMRGVFATNKNRFVCVGNEYGYIVNYEIPASGIPEKKWEYFLSEPLYDIKNDGHISWNDDKYRRILRRRDEFGICFCLV